MEFKHSPAPWRYTVRNANEIMTTFHGVTIGDVYLDITTANQKADAHLIASAPELLESLRELVSAMERYEIDVGESAPVKHKEMMNKANSAIAKALGI
ncbi:XkdD [Proteus phage vB_PvuS_Pm34]|nr:XkdD [Proteus phage vB_PvuS_Pm34]